MTPNSQSHQHSAEKSEIDLAASLEVVVENRWLISAIVAVFVLIGAIYLALTKPVYRADLSVQVEQQTPDASGGNVVSSATALFAMTSPTAGEIEILRSRLVVDRAVEQLRLYITASPKYFPLLGWGIAHHHNGLSTAGLFGFGGFAWGNESIKVSTFDVPRDLEGVKFTLTALSGNRYKLSIPGSSQSFEGRAGVLERFTIPTGQIALQIDELAANPGIEFVLARYSRQDIVEGLQRGLVIEEKGKQQSGIIGATLEGTNAEMVSRTLDEIGRQYVRQNVERKSAEAEHSLAFLNDQLPKIKERLYQAEERFNTVRTKDGVVDLDASGKMLIQQDADAQTQLFALRQKREDLASRFTSSHPAVAAIDEQIAQYQALLGKLEAEIKGMPEVQQQVLRLQLDVEVNKDLYLSLLQSAQQLKLLKAGKIGTVRVVDRPVVPRHPVKPVQVLVLAISAAVGLLFGFAAAFVRNMLFGGVTDPHEIERFTGMTVYATLPYSEPQRDIAKRISAKEPRILLLAETEPNHPTIESLRSLRTSLQFAMLEAKNNVVMFTGPAPGVGKSFVSANFAAVMASTGKRVLLIDSDIRRGHLNQYLGIGRENGLSELIAGTIDAARAVHKSLIPNLDFIPTGVLPPNPAELLLSAKLPQILQQLSGEYDYVITDTSPVLAAADTAIIAPYVGTVFLIAFAGKSKVGEIVESARRLEQAGVQVRGVAFNGMKPHSGRYGYGSKYGSYRYVAYKYDQRKD